MTACTPSQTASGTYHGTFTGLGLPNNSGNATAYITENGADQVNINMQCDGNPEYQITGVAVTKMTFYGQVYYSLSFNNDPWSLSGGMFLSNGEMDLTYSCDTSAFSLSFNGVE